jgi:hypothetical protein
MVSESSCVSAIEGGILMSGAKLGTLSNFFHDFFD